MIQIRFIFLFKSGSSKPIRKHGEHNFVFFETTIKHCSFNSACKKVKVQRPLKFRFIRSKRTKINRQKEFKVSFDCKACMKHAKFFTKS